MHTDYLLFASVQLFARGQIAINYTVLVQQLLKLDSIAYFDHIFCKVSIY